MSTGDDRVTFAPMTEDLLVERAAVERLTVQLETLRKQRGVAQAQLQEFLIMQGNIQSSPTAGDALRATMQMRELARRCEDLKREHRSVALRLNGVNDYLSRGTKNSSPMECDILLPAAHFNTKLAELKARQECAVERLPWDVACPVRKMDNLRRAMSDEWVARQIAATDRHEAAERAEIINGDLDV